MKDMEETEKTDERYHASKRLESIRRRLAYINYEMWEMNEDSYHIYVLGSSEWVSGDVRDKEAGEFIAHAPEDIQWLLEKLERFEKLER